jgi:hypothetical protein
VKTENWIELAQDRVLMPPVVNLEILLGYNSRLIVNKEETCSQVLFVTALNISTACGNVPILSPKQTC